MRLLKECKYITHVYANTSKRIFGAYSISYSFYEHKETKKLYIKYKSTSCLKKSIVRMENINYFVNNYKIYFYDFYDGCLRKSAYEKIRIKNLLKKVPQLKAYFALDLL